ncbi:hypothetical protein D3C71_1182590 [compost metagenome]
MAGSLAGSPSSTSVSRASTGTLPSGSEFCASTSAIPLSCTMYARRSAGYSGSSGTYAPPAFRIASSPTTISKPRSSARPTRVSVPTPSAIRRCASRLARVFSSR